MLSLDAEKLRTFLNYDHETGVFTWKVQSSDRMPIGSKAGSLHNRYGYLYIQIDKQRFRAHRLAWLYVHGVMPTNHIDHINRNRSDNRIVNLRDCLPANNSKNQTVRKKNKTGILGVGFCKTRRKFYSDIGVGSKTIHLGRFDTLEEAAIVRKEAETKYFGEFAPARLA